jgi:hypothetical protein
MEMSRPSVRMSHALKYRLADRRVVVLESAELRPCGLGLCVAARADQVAVRFVGAKKAVVHYPFSCSMTHSTLFCITLRITAHDVS